MAFDTLFICVTYNTSQEGTELFKGQNYRQAGARYSKALTHAAKMFDLSSDEQKEVYAVQLSLYLNLAQCYLKLQSWDQVGRAEKGSALRDRLVAHPTRSVVVASPRRCVLLSLSAMGFHVSVLCVPVLQLVMEHRMAEWCSLFRFLWQIGVIIGGGFRQDYCCCLQQKQWGRRQREYAEWGVNRCDNAVALVINSPVLLPGPVRKGHSVCLLMASLPKD